MKSIDKISLFTVLLMAAVSLNACSSSSSGSGSSCAAGANDFYVVENAACAAGAGKLSRINPDALCKEEILTGLNCPVDFVPSTVDNGIGYLSSRTDGILQVNVSEKTSIIIATTTNIVSPAGLFLMENITESERRGPCGGNTLVDAILMIADEGTELDGGMVWRWCLITDDPTVLESGNNPSPVSEVSPAQIKHPRGVVIKNRTQAFASGHNPDIEDTTQSALLATWTLNEAALVVPTFLTNAGDFSGDIKDITLDTDGTVLIADPGQNAVLRYNPTAGTLTTLSPSLTGGPRDMLPANANGNYMVTQFDSGVVSQTSFVAGTAVSTVTTGLSLSGPDGIAQ